MSRQTAAPPGLTLELAPQQAARLANILSSVCPDGHNEETLRECPRLRDQFEEASWLGYWLREQAILDLTPTQHKSLQEILRSLRRASLWTLEDEAIWSLLEPSPGSEAPARSTVPLLVVEPGPASNAPVAGAYSPV